VTLTGPVDDTARQGVLDLFDPNDEYTLNGGTARGDEASGRLTGCGSGWAMCLTMHSCARATCWRAIKAMLCRSAATSFSVGSGRRVVKIQASSFVVGLGAQQSPRSCSNDCPHGAASARRCERRYRLHPHAAERASVPASSRIFGLPHVV
jgi:hypothetical protein